MGISGKPDMHREENGKHLKAKEEIRRGKNVHRLSRGYSESYQQVINRLGINYVKHVNK